MSETEFWPALEYRVCRELAGVEQCAQLGMWCDGFVADSFNDDADRISGRAWICFGARQEEWTFDLVLPTPVVRRDEIAWSVLLPKDGETDWLTVDRERKHVVVAPGDAVGDAA